MLNRRGLAVFTVFVAAGVGASGCRREAAAPAPVTPPLPVRAAKAPAPEPFTHPLFAQAERRVSNEDCSRGALWAVAQQLRGLHKQVRAARPTKSVPAPGTACLSPPAEAMATMLRGPLLERVGGCVGRDGPYDAEWDMVNSSVLSLGVCLDCNRSGEQRAQDCKHAIEKIDRAEKNARSGTVEQRTIDAQAGR